MDFEPMYPGFESWESHHFFNFFFMFFLVIVITVQIQHYCPNSDSPTLLLLMMSRPPEPSALYFFHKHVSFRTFSALFAGDGSFRTLYLPFTDPFLE